MIVKTRDKIKESFVQPFKSEVKKKNLSTATRSRDCKKGNFNFKTSHYESEVQKKKKQKNTRSRE